MSAYAKQKRREQSCFSPKTGQAAASHEKPGYGQQHDDTTGHHPKAHQVRLGIHSNLGFGRHRIFFFPKRFSVFAALPQGKVKDTFGYKKNRFGHFQNDILMELISRELSIERRGPFCRVLRLRMNFKSWSFAAVVLTAFPFGAAADDLDEARVKALVLEAIREKPEIVMEAVEILRKREAEAQAVAQTEVLTSQRDMLERDSNAPVLGNPNGDVTIVEFFDYNCPYCRRVKPESQALLKEDANIRLVYREWPILGEGSVFAARAALAAREQGKYAEFHWALMALQERAEEASVLRVAKQVGLDLEQLSNDMNDPSIEQHISTSMRLTQQLGFNGTPSFVIGDELVAGFVEKEKLAGLVDNARARDDKK